VVRQVLERATGSVGSSMEKENKRGIDGMRV
jgi:hypothetical protein